MRHINPAIKKTAMLNHVLEYKTSDAVRPSIVGKAPAIKPNRASLLSRYLFHLYKVQSRVLRDWIRVVVLRLEGGEFYSETLRRIFREYYKVEIGLYTHGSCFVPAAMDRYTTFGRYCSIAIGARTLNINHPMDFKSMHGFFFNPKLGFCRQDLMNYIPLTVGNDVWLGANCLILPHVKQIGDGAVIAAGAVVNKDVPPYAVVVGNPARVVRFRFPNAVIDHLLEEKWWQKPVEELDLNEFTRPFLTSSTPDETPELIS